MFVPVLWIQEDAQELLKNAQSALNKGKYEDAIRLGIRAADQFIKIGDQKNVIRANTDVGLAQMYSGQYAAALKTFQAAYDAASRIHDGEYEITSLSNIGTVRYFT